MLAQFLFTFELVLPGDVSIETVAKIVLEVLPIIRGAYLRGCQSVPRKEVGLFAINWNTPKSGAITWDVGMQKSAGVLETLVTMGQHRRVLHQDKVDYIPS